MIILNIYRILLHMLRSNRVRFVQYLGGGFNVEHVEYVTDF